MSKEQFEEIEKSIRNTPAQSLARRLPQNGNLNALRKTLFDLKIHDDLVQVIRRKYFPDTYWDKKVTTAKEHLDSIDLPHEVARVVQKAWNAADDDKKVTELVRKQDVEANLAETATGHPASVPESTYSQLLSGQY